MPQSKKAKTKKLPTDPGIKESRDTKVKYVTPANEIIIYFSYLQKRFTYKFRFFMS